MASAQGIDEVETENEAAKVTMSSGMRIQSDVLKPNLWKGLMRPAQQVTASQIAGLTTPTLAAALILSSIIYVVAILDSSGGLVHAANAVGPIIVLCAAVAAGKKTVNRYPVAVWTGYFWFLVNSALFYGIGPLIFSFGDEATVSHLETGPFALDRFELLRTNLLNSVGILTVLLTFGVITKQVDLAQVADRQTCRARDRLDIPLALIATIFLVVGAALRYLLIVPYVFGMTDLVLPGVIMTSGELFDLGLAVVAYLAVTRRGVWIWLLWALLPLHVTTCLLEFAKSKVALALILPALGAFWGHRNIYRLAAWLGVATLSVILLQPYAQFGRNTIFARPESHRRASFGERLEIAKDFLEQPHWFSLQRGGVQDFQSGWSRLAYSGTQAIAMREYDAGRPGHTLENIWYIFIPRLLWPDKPVIDVSMDFYDLVTGRRGTHLGVTVYANGYWHSGWLGVIAASAFMGAVFAFTTRLSLKWIQNGELIFLPVVLLGIDMAIRGPNNFLIMAFIAPLPIYFAYIVAAKAFANMVRRKYGQIDDVPIRPKAVRAASQVLN